MGRPHPKGVSAGAWHGQGHRPQEFQRLPGFDERPKIHAQLDRPTTSMPARGIALGGTRRIHQGWVIHFNSPYGSARELMSNRVVVWFGLESGVWAGMSGNPGNIVFWGMESPSTSTQETSWHPSSLPFFPRSLGGTQENAPTHHHVPYMSPGRAHES